MTRLRDRLAAGLTVDVPDGPDAYRTAGWILRVVAMLALAGVGMALLAALFLFPLLAVFGQLEALFGSGFSVVAVGFAAVIVSFVLASILFLLVVNHLHLGWAARAGWALWGTRLFTGLVVVSSLASAFQAAGSSDPVAALSGLGLGTLVMGALHVLTWMEGTREAFQEAGPAEEDVDAVLESRG